MIAIEGFRTIFEFPMLIFGSLKEDPMKAAILAVSSVYLVFLLLRRFGAAHQTDHWQQYTQRQRSSGLDGQRRRDISQEWS